MKKIAALLDFTTTTHVVLNFAKSIALQKNAEVALITIIEKGNERELANAEIEMKAASQLMQDAQVKCKIEIHEGDFVDTIGMLLIKLHADLAIIGTHGKIGLKQNLFGSNILKLVKQIQIPSLVVQNNSKLPENGFKSVLFPIAAHSRFDMKINQTKELLSKDGKFFVYAIYKTDILENGLRNNLAMTEEVLSKSNLDYEMIEEDPQLYSVGYSRQTLAYLDKNPADLISIMSQVAKNNQYFGNVDKENIILNEPGIPVLCCNDDQIHD